MKDNYSLGISKSYYLEKDKIMRGIQKLKLLGMNNGFDTHNTFSWKKGNSTNSPRIIDHISDQTKLFTIKKLDHLFVQSDLFKVTFHLKSIGHLFYYLATITETVDEQILTPIPNKQKVN